LWLGGIAFVLLAAGVISAVAIVQSSRPLPFETWARRDLMQRTDGMPGAMTTDAVAPGQSASAPEDAPTARSGPVAALHDAIAALARVITAGLEPAAADPQPEAVDAALGSYARPEPSDIHIAGLGPILASANAADELAANFSTPWLSSTEVETRAERLFHAPPRPVFKPTLVSLSRGEPEEPARPAPR
jgi:hypothetical protein